MTSGTGPNARVLPTGAAFHESLAAEWSGGYTRRNFGRRRSAILAILEERVLAEQKWLDLGCGSGNLAVELLKLGAHVTAVDGSPSMLAAARAAFPETSRMTLIESDVTNLPSLADGTFDGILCSSVVEYVEAPQKLLTEAARVLRPGGRLILSVPATLSPVRCLQKAVRGLFALVGKRAFSYLEASLLEINPKWIPAWLEKPGFILDRVIGFDPVLGKGLGTFRPALLIIDARKHEG